MQWRCVWQQQTVSAVAAAAAAGDSGVAALAGRARLDGELDEASLGSGREEGRGGACISKTTGRRATKFSVHTGWHPGNTLATFGLP